jgi:hypothetical protein
MVEDWNVYFKMGGSPFLEMRVTMEIKNHIISLCLFFIIIAILGPMASASEEKTASEYDTGVYYKVRKGDTLWDISKRFFDSPVLWPDLWKENKQITNPHWIYPGDEIRLHRDTSGFDIETREPEAEEEPKPVAVIEPTPIPEQPPEPAYFVYNAIDRIGFVKKIPVTASGTIFKSQDDNRLIGTGDTIYIRKLNDNSFDPGSRYTIYRTIRHGNLEGSDFTGGTQHYLVGVAQITVIEPKFAVGKIIRSYRSIQAGDLLIPYHERPRKIMITESKEDIQGRIIGSEGNRTIMGEETVAFIDKGELDGMVPGQIYRVFYQEKMRESPRNPKEIILTPIDIGTIFILHTDDNTSTVLITDAQRAISPGAMFRTPAPPGKE